MKTLRCALTAALLLAAIRVPATETLQLAPGAEQAHVTLLIERLARMEAMLEDLQAELRRRGNSDRAG